MRKNVSTMSVKEIECELEKFAWEYVVLADKAQSDEQYRRGEIELDNRKVELQDELKRKKDREDAYKFHNGKPWKCPNCGVTLPAVLSKCDSCI